MSEDVIINVQETGAEQAAKNIASIGEAAAKADKSVQDFNNKGVKGLSDGQRRIAEATADGGKTMRAWIADMDRAKNATNELGASANQGGSAVSGFGKQFTAAMAAIGAVQALTNFVKNVVSTTQALGLAEAKLRSYTQSNAEFTAVSAQFASAVGSMSANIGGLTTAFAELRTSSSYVNVESSKIASVLTNASNAIRAGGASSKEAAAGVNDFAKAMSDGYISGKEFQELQKNYPELAKAVASASGMSAESIKVMGISANDAARGLQNASSALREKAEANLTLSERVQMVVDAMANAILEFDKATGASKLLVTAITDGVQIIKEFYNAIEPLVKLIGSLLYDAIKLVIDIIKGLVSAIQTVVNWFGSWGAAIKDVTSALTSNAAASDKSAAAAKNSANASQQSANALKNEAAAANQAAAAKSALNAQNRSNDSGSNEGNQTAQQRFDQQTKNMPSTFIGARAEGGPVRAGSRYLVGEEGPELFVPGVSGTIVPNGGSSATAVANDNSGASPRRAQQLLSEAVTEGTDASLRKIYDAVTETNVILKSMTSSGSGGGSVGMGGSGSLGGGGNNTTSALNNYVQLTGGDGSAASTAKTGGSSSSGGGSTAESDITNLTNGQINAYVKGYYDLIAKNANTKGMYLTDKQRQNNYLNAERYLANVPSSVRDMVKQIANANLPTQVTGGEIKFRSGGGFTVPGGTGVDSKLVQMRVTPGEEIDVRTRKQRRDEQGTGGGETHISVSMTVNTPDADSFRKSEKQISREFLTRMAKAVA